MITKYFSFGVTALLITAIGFITTILLAQPVALPPSIPKVKFEIMATFVTPYDDPPEQITLVRCRVPVPDHPVPDNPSIPRVDDLTSPRGKNMIFMMVKGPVQQLEKAHIIWLAYDLEGIPEETRYMGNVAFDPDSGRAFVIIGIQTSPYCDFYTYQVNLMNEKKAATSPSTDPTFGIGNPAATQQATLRGRDTPIHDYGTFFQAFDLAKADSWPHGQKAISHLSLDQHGGGMFGGQRLFACPQTDSSFIIYLKGYHRDGDSPDSLLAFGFDPITLKWCNVGLEKKGEIKSDP